MVAKLVKTMTLLGAAYVLLRESTRVKHSLGRVQRRMAMMAAATLTMMQNRLVMFYFLHKYTIIKLINLYGYENDTLSGEDGGERRR
jgi:hypothetical protein